MVPDGRDDWYVPPVTPRTVQSTAPRSTSDDRTRAGRIGAVAGLVGVTVIAAPGVTAPVEAGEPIPEPQCIDTIGNPANDDSDTWDLDTWDAYLGTCEADFGLGKLIIDVVTEGGEPLPGEVDLDAIVRALEFGYADPARDAQRLRFDAYCELMWDSGRFQSEDTYLAETSGYTDFRRDESLGGPGKLLLEILGDRDDPTGPGAAEYEIDPNEALLTPYCAIADSDQLRQNAIADVGGGYRLLAGVNETYANGDFEFLGWPPAMIQVVVSQQPPPTTTTSTTTTTTIPASTTTTAATTTTTAAATTTTAAATTTTTEGPAVAAPGPTTTVTVPRGGVLPATGGGNGAMALIALALLGLGGLTMTMSRRRTAQR